MILQYTETSLGLQCPTCKVNMNMNMVTKHTYSDYLMHYIIASNANNNLVKLNNANQVDITLYNYIFVMCGIHLLMYFIIILRIHTCDYSLKCNSTLVSEPT